MSTSSTRKYRRNGNGYHSRNALHLLHTGHDFFERVAQMIDGAQHSIHLQTYIFQNDSTGTQVAEHLLAAAQRGVKVYVLVDGYASQNLPHAFVERLRNGGVYFSFFDPLLKSKRFYFGRRMHHKVLVADSRVALVGASNIADRYNDLPDIPAWLNMDLYIEGESAAELAGICRHIWNKRTHRLYIPPEPKPQADHFAEGHAIRVRRNDWVTMKSQISRSYQELFGTAHTHITIVCSYFLPGMTFRKKMRQAVQRGVKIQVVVAGPSDVPLAKHAERYLYRWMLRNGMELYEYQPTVLHAKLASRDGEWMTVGSYNVNDLSAYASLEMNVDIRSQTFVQQTEEELQRIIREECIQILPHRRHNVFMQLWEWTSYQSLRLLLFLFTFYFRREKE